MRKWFCWEKSNQFFIISVLGGPSSGVAHIKKQRKGLVIDGKYDMVSNRLSVKINLFVGTTLRKSCVVVQVHE